MWGTGLRVQGLGPRALTLTPWQLRASLTDIHSEFDSICRRLPGTHGFMGQVSNFVRRHPLVGCLGHKVEPRYLTVSILALLTGHKYRDPKPYRP